MSFLQLLLFFLVPCVTHADAGIVENSVTALPSTLVEKQQPAWLGIYFRFTVPLQTGSVVTYFASESVFNASTTSTPDILFSATCTASYTVITSNALTLTLKPSPGHVSCSAASNTYISIPQTYLLRNPSAGTQVYVNVATLLPTNKISSMTAPQYTTTTSEIHSSPTPLPSPSPDEPGVLNFECSTALPITCSDTVSADLGAAPFMGQNSCAGIKHSGPQLWYAVNAPPGQLFVSTCDGANFDTLLTVMSGQCSDLQCITTNDDSCGMQSRAEVKVTEPTLYYIMIYGYHGLKGMFNMTISCISTLPLPSDSPPASPEPWNMTCSNSPADWADYFGNTCATYAELHWCAEGAVTIDSLNGLSISGLDDVYYGLSADQVCCVCGGGVQTSSILPSPMPWPESSPDDSAGCVDTPAGWADYYGNSCAKYAESHWCAGGAVGEGWPVGYSFAEYADVQYGLSADQVCCICGGGMQASPILPSPTPWPESSPDDSDQCAAIISEQSSDPSMSKAQACDNSWTQQILAEYGCVVQPGCTIYICSRTIPSYLLQSLDTAC